MEFRTQYDRKEVFTEPGSPIRTIRAAEYDKNKNIVVVDKGEENLYAYINSFADSVDIHVLLARFMNGDKEALLQRAGAYIDISALPTNINEFIELARNAENLFNSLPIDVKESFNNNMMEFVSTIGDKEWIEKMSKSPLQIQMDKNEEFKKTSKAHKEAIKNTVYGDQIEEDESIPSPSVNPLTGNEVNEK